MRFFTALVMRHIASGAELWFEKLGLRVVPSHSDEPFHPARVWLYELSYKQTVVDRRKKAGRISYLAKGARTTMSSALRSLAVAIVAAVFFGEIESAWAGMGQPSSWQIGLQDPATPVMTDIIWFHNLLLWIIIGIVILVLALLVTVIVRFNAKTNPQPARTTHNTLIELIWTVIPVMILVFIAVPSFRLMFFQLNTPPADVTIKATGKQWFWSYAYPDNGNFEFDSLMLKDSERKPGQPRLLAVDNEMVVPVNKVVRVQTIGADVIHSFAVPSFGIKIDAIPGRLNETWFKATREGVYYGQCSELCGRDHAFMPIAVRVVSEQAFAEWAAQAKQKYAGDGAEALSVAATTPRRGD